MFTLAILIGLVIRLLVNQGESTQAYLQENWPSGVLIIVGGSALMTVIERSRWTLRVLERDKLEGPTGLFNERVVIPKNEIDWERTKRSLSSRLGMGNAIYGAGRLRVIVSQWFFNPDDLKELLGMLGYKAG
jgi:hypothetical protein